MTRAAIALLAAVLVLSPVASAESGPTSPRFNNLNAFLDHIDEMGIDGAVNFVKKQIARGADNREIAEMVTRIVDKRIDSINNPSNDTVAWFKEKRLYYTHRQAKFKRWSAQNLYVYKYGAKWGWENRMGHCEEHAAAAYYILKHAGVQPPPRRVKSGDHAFVVIGLDETDVDLRVVEQPLMWGHDVFVVDPWQGDYFDGEQAFANEYIARRGKWSLEDRTALVDPVTERKLHKHIAWNRERLEWGCEPGWFSWRGGRVIGIGPNTGRLWRCTKECPNPTDIHLYWHPKREKWICHPAEKYEWDAVKKQCVDARRTEIETKDCGGYNYAVWVHRPREKDQPLQGARLKIKGPLSREETTDDEGSASIHCLPPGRYGVTVEYKGAPCHEDELEILGEGGTFAEVSCDVTYGIGAGDPDVPSDPSGGEPAAGSVPDGWTVYAHVIDQDGRGISGACVKKPGFAAGCAEALGDGRYLYGTVRRFLDQPTSMLQLLATAYHSDKGVVAMPHSQFKPVSLGADAEVTVTFQFPFSLKQPDPAPPSFIRAGDTRVTRPSFIESSTITTTRPKPAIPAPKPKQQAPPARPEPLPPEPEPLRKLSDEECVKKFCSMCMFLFGERPDLEDFPEDECGRCMKANEGRIRQCWGS